MAAKSMNEIGINIPNQWSKHIAELPMQEFDYVITLCDHAAQNCLVFFGKGCE